MMDRPAILALEDGTIFRGTAFGAQGERCGEVVFNTSMTGYQEVLTDPSYRGQIVAMTYPLIGNYGINAADAESRGIWLEGFVVRELSRVVSNWRSEMDVDAYLKKQNVPGIQGVDTRELTKRLRTVGALKGILSTQDVNVESLLAKVRSSPGLGGRDLVQSVSCPATYRWQGDGGTKLEPPAGVTVQSGSCRVLVMDCGVKYGILRRLQACGCEVMVVPSSTTAQQVAELDPDGIMLSNGPGDPEPVTNVISTVQQLIKDPPRKRPLPIFGICLGQQILGLALGGKTYKLKFGHHGANQPVKDLRTGQVAITVQNHGFCVDVNTLPSDEIEVTHMNLNDQTLEGLQHKRLPIFSVQYHPEASPGPHDARYLFDRFVELMEKHRK